MIREHSWLKSTLGEQNLDNLATWFENAYSNSIKAEMDAMGITSHTMHGSADASELASGIEQVAPDFAKASQSAIRQDIYDAAKSGDVSLGKAAIAVSKSAYASAKAGTIARAYENVIEALHNGVRYSAHAANRNNITDVDKHISDMRRLSADASQHGGNDTLNRVNGALMYANLGIQSIYEVGKRAKDDPLNFLTNMGALTGTIAALHYGAIASDPEAAERHKMKTPQQRARSLTTFGGAEIPLDPVARLFISPLFAIYDHISGVADGNFNPDFFQVMDSWLEGGTELGEEGNKEIDISLWEAIRSNNPFAPDAFPPISAAMAAAGVDPGMTRVSGSTMMERTQELTGTDEDLRRPDALTAAHIENVLGAMFSTVGRSVLQMADDMYRAYGKSGDMNKAIDQGMQRWKDTASKGGGLFRPFLYGNYEGVESAADVNFQLMKDRDDGIQTALNLYQKDVKTGGLISTFTPRYSQVMPREEGILPPKINGTEAGYIAEMASQLERLYLSKNRQILAGLGKQVEGYNAQYLTKIEDRNKAINQINEERRYQRMMMLTQTRDYERLISERIGRPFTFDGFNPDDYTNPMGPSN